MAKNIFSGSLVADSIYFGTLDVDKVYFGNILVWEKQVLPKLLAPSITLSDSILTIIDNSEGEIAESFNVYIDSILATNVLVPTITVTELVDASGNTIIDSSGNVLTVPS